MDVYHYQGDRETAIQRLTAASLYVFNSPRRDRVELDADLSVGELWAVAGSVARIQVPVAGVMGCDPGDQNIRAGQSERV